METLGLAREQALGKPVTEIPGLARFKQYLADFTRVVVTGQRFTQEVLVGERWFVLIFTRIGAETVAVVGIDITRRKRMEEAIRETEQRFRSVLEESLDAAYRRDLRTDRYDYMSPVIEDLTGYSVAEMTTMSIADAIECIHPDDRANVAEQLAEAEKTGRLKVEYRFKGKDGHYRWLRDYATVHKDSEGHLLHRGGIVREVTEHKEAEQALAEALAREKKLAREKDGARSELVRLLAHEIRNPMAALKGLAQLLEVRVADESARQLAGVMAGEVDRLSRMLTKVLDAFRTQAGSLPFRDEPLDLAGVVEAALLVYRSAETHPYEVSMERPVMVRGDAVRLEDVVRNLLANAEKYSASGLPIHVRLRAEARERRALLEVRDHGVGIPSGQLGHLFQPFFRGNNVAFQGPGGTGLGLYLCRSIVEQHGGRIWVESEEGKGATFYVELPLHAAQADEV